MRCFKIIYLFLGFVSVSFAQQEVIKTLYSNAQNIEIDTQGLDQITIVNSSTDLIEIILFDQNPNSHNISYKEQKDFLKVNFEVSIAPSETIFRKFITKRLNRATGILKIPKNRKVTVLGSEVDIISNSYQGEIYVYIEKGYVNLHEVKKNAFLKLFKGNVYADVSNSSIYIETVDGNITLRDTLLQGKYSKKYKKTSKIFSVKSIHANVNLISN